MFNYPIIPIVVFILLAVPPVIFGFIRGWKASLLLALLVLAFVGIEVLVASLAYNGMWNLFKGFYIGNVQQGLSVESLKEVAKPSVVMLFVGICLLPNYLFSLLIYFPFRHKLKKHLYPVTSDINDNEKSIERNNRIVSRAAGASIGLVSAAFFASAASTSASIMFVDKNERNGFNKFTSKVANWYTFGNGKYNEELMYSMDIAQTYLTTKYQNDFAKIFYLGKGSAGDVIDVNVFNELSSGELHDQIVKLKESERIMESLTEMIMSSDALNGKKRIELIDMDYLATNHEYTGMDGFLDSVASDAKNHPLGLKLPENVIDKMLAKVSDSVFKDFKKTGFQRRYDDGESLLSTLRVGLVKLRTKRREYTKIIRDNKATIASDYYHIASLVAQIKAIGIIADPAKGDSFNYNNLVRGDDKDSTGTNTPLTIDTGSINTADVQLTNLETIKADAKTAKTNSDNDFVGGWDAAINSGGSSKVNKDNEEDMNNKKTTMDNTQSDLNSANVERTRLEGVIADLTTQINNAPGLITAQEQIITTQTGIRDTEDAKITSLTTVVDADKNNMDAATRERDGFNSQISDQQTIVQNADSEISAANAAISTAQADKAAAEAKVNTAKSKVKIEQDAIDALNSRKNNLNNADADYATKVASIDSDIATHSRNKGTYEGIVTSESAKVKTADDQLTAAKTQKKNAEDKKKQANDEIVRINPLKAAKESQLVSYTNTYNTNKAKLIAATNNKSEAVRKLSEANTEKARLQGDKATNEANKVAQVALLTTEKSKITRLETELSSNTQSYNQAKAKYDNFHSGTYLPQKNLYESNKDKYNKASTDVANQNDVISSAKTKRQDLKARIDALITERKEKLSELYSTSDMLAKLDNKAIDASKTSEDYTPGADNGDPKDKQGHIIQYKPEQQQDAIYIAWSENTIKGKAKYIENMEKDSKAFKIIRDQKEKEYKALEDKYLQTIKDILKS